MIKFNEILLLNKILILVFVLQINAQFSERIISSNRTVDSKCLNLIKNQRKNITRLESCEAFKCFEDRFPCGKKYWIMNWGYKYCVRYANPEYINKFTEKGKQMLEHLNKCLPKFLEKNYKSNKPLNCNRLGTSAFKAQGRCYLEILDTFCTGFPENKDLFIKVLDQGDFLNFDSIDMISKVADKCNPKLDLTSFIFSSG